MVIPFCSNFEYSIFIAITYLHGIEVFNFIWIRPDVFFNQSTIQHTVCWNKILSFSASTLIHLFYGFVCSYDFYWWSKLCVSSFYEQKKTKMARLVFRIQFKSSKCVVCNWRTYSMWIDSIQMYFPLNSDNKFANEHSWANRPTWERIMNIVKYNNHWVMKIFAKKFFFFRLFAIISILLHRNGADRR